MKVLYAIQVHKLHAGQAIRDDIMSFYQQMICLRRSYFH